MNLGPQDYVGKPLNSRQGQAFQPWDTSGYLSIEVLPNLKGRPWDALALGMCHALRPSHLRVVTDGIQLDAQTWRVTVWIDAKTNLIRQITQEVEVGLPDGVPHGQGMETALCYGMDSDEVAWENLPGMVCYDSASVSQSGEAETYKLHNGKKTPFPR